MTKRIMKEFIISEISGVDRPAQKGAKALIMKRDDGTGGDIGKGMALTSEMNGHTHLLNTNSYIGDDVSSGTTDYAGSGDDWHSHPWIKMSDGTIVIGVSASHTHTIEVTNDGDDVLKIDAKRLTSLIEAVSWDETMVDEATHIHTLAKELDVLGELITGEGKLAGLLKSIEGKTPIGKNKEPDMSNENKDAEALADLQKKLDRAEAIGTMTDVVKAHFETLTGTEADAFLAKSQEDRETEVSDITKAAEASDPVVYTTDAGLKIRKSDGAIVASLAKRADDLEKKNAVLSEAASTADLQKRAGELKNLPGDEATRMAILKSIDAIEDEEVRKNAMKSLTAQNERMASAFETIGKQGGAGVVPGSAGEQLETLAKAYQEKHPEASSAVAMDAVLKTEQGEALYVKSLN